MLALRIGSTLALSLAVSTACSSSSVEPAAADAGGGLVDYTAYAVDQGAAPTSAWTPVSGVSAFLDTATGRRVEATSEADGKMVFRGVDFGPGPATITAYAPLHVMSSVVGVTPEAVAKQPLPFPAFPAGGKSQVLFVPLVKRVNDTVKLSGTIKGKKAEINKVVISTAGGRSLFESIKTDYSLDVVKGTPLTIVAMESEPGTQSVSTWNETKLRWLKFDVPAQSTNATVDLDLATATPLPTTKVSVTLAPPEGGTLGASPIWQVQGTGESPFLLGSRSIVAPNADGKTFKTEGEFIGSPVVSETPMTVAVFPGVSGESALVMRGGVPTEGSTYDGLMFPKGPQSGAMGSDIALSGIDPKAELVAIDIVDHAGTLTQQFLDTPVWRIGTIRGAPTPGSIHIPDLPDAARALLPASPSGRVVVAAEQLDAARPAMPAKVAFSKFFPIKK